ncbi:maleylacetoacetate isomerase [Cupriavidus pauculus]|uniref:maleylacetoacetate isomerase n=1 Tax=Cupriavidus pauculus TaxID=82633 RepID=UPI000781F4C9|nr:maleylacetoacetate isomerase [Cupriavidus pauculus]
MSNTPKLLNYFRSSASYRVRIALNLKGLPYEYVPVHLNRGGGEQFYPEFTQHNPQALVPVYEEDDISVSQSLAIIEYLEEKYPEVALLPRDPAGRARVRQLSLAVACDVHPLNNLRVLKYLTGPLGVSEDAKMQWIQHWIGIGLEALETAVATNRPDGAFCHGDTPSIADCCLLPQLFGARRFGINVEKYPTLASIERACNAIPAFQEASPEKQPDAE